MRKRDRTKNCYCHACDKDFNALGIMSHRAAHRRRKTDCSITFSTGQTLHYQFSNEDDTRKGTYNF